MGLPRRWRTQRLPNANVCISRAVVEKGWHILDHDLASDVETSERTALDQIAGIVGFSRIDREDVIAPHIHVWAEEV